MLDLIAVALLLLFVAVATAITTTEKSSLTSRDNNEYLAPLHHDCSEDDPNCQIKEGSYIVSLHGFYRISSHLTFLERKLQRDPSVNWQAYWHDHEKSASYIVHNVTQEGIKAIRRDPGVYEVEQLYYAEFDLGWYLECRLPGLSEERKRFCYEELDVAQCEKSWLTEEEKKDCLERTAIPFCDIEGLVLSEEERRYCSESSASWDGQAREEFKEL